MITPQGDKLVTCRCCGSNACYESQFKTLNGEVKTWMCMTCGFTSNTTMEENSEVLKKAEEFTAEMIKDLKQVHAGLAWFPTVITMPEKGMIFPEPTKGYTTDKKYTNAKEIPWVWTVVKAIPIPEEEQDKYPDPKNPGTNYKFKMEHFNFFPL